MGSNKYQNLSNKQKLKAFIPWLNHLVKNIHLKYHSCKKILSNRFTRYLLITSICLMLLVFWVMFVKMPRDKVKKSVEMTQVLSKTLGTRITAVRAKPNMNTTLLQPSTYHCNEGKTFAIILINSRPEDIQRRKILRNTWLQFLSKTDVMAFFFIGLSANMDNTNLQNEANENKDIIIEDIEENFYLLGLKALRMLKWFRDNCSKAKYLIKTDDSMFLNVPNLISHINSVPQSWVNYIGGDLHLSDPVDRDPDSKYFAPKDWYPDEVYPPYVTGGLVVISSEIVPNLFNKSLTIPLFHLEDIFLTGILGFQNLQLVPSNIPRIESSSLNIVRLKMAFSLRDLAKTNIAFHYWNDPDFIEELYYQSIS